MKLRILAILVLAAMMLSLFAACSSNEVLTDKEAQQIALEDAGLADFNISAHSHFSVHEGEPQFEVHFSHAGQEYEYLIHGRTGEILSSNP